MKLFCFFCCFPNSVMIIYMSSRSGELVKRLNTPPFHGGIHGSESRTRHHMVLGVSYNGSTSVSKTANGSSILSTPALTGKVEHDSANDVRLSPDNTVPRMRLFFAFSEENKEEEPHPPFLLCSYSGCFLHILELSAIGQHYNDRVRMAGCLDLLPIKLE